MIHRKLKYLKIIQGIRNSLKSVKKNCFLPLLLILLVVLICRCESKDRFYRPDLPEKLSCIGIIDVDDTTLRHISFEKSFQSEYPEELNDSLRDFSFSISSASGELFNYHCNSSMKNIKDLRIPDSIIFIPGEKYYLKANEKDAKEITAEIIDIKPPPEPQIISIKKVTTLLTEPIVCYSYGDDTAKSVIINFSFEKNQNLYYAILVKGWGYSLSSTFNPWPGFMDFTIKEGNTPGFFAEIQGLKTYHYVCGDKLFITVERSPAYAWFIEGRKIPDPVCRVTLAVRFADEYNINEVLKAVSIKILSIPEDLYLFEKSLNIYEKTSGDPFAEPVYLGGNIKGGAGIFALCRSKESKITFPHFF